MKLDQNSFYRNKIIPWYDSTFICWIFILISAVTLIFGGTGIFVATNTPAYRDYLWVPCLISGFSLIVIIKISARMIQRNKNA